MAVLLNPYLTFPGTTREAMEYYQKVLGGELTVQTFKEFGAPVSEGYQDKVMHAQLTNGDIALMASDPQEGLTPVVGDSITLSLSGGPSDRERLSAMFADLADGGNVQMPLSEAPWGAVFGMLTDRYGINWMTNISLTQE